MAHQAGSYLRFPCSMKLLEVFLLPLNGVYVLHRVTPYIRRYPFIHLGGERHYGTKVSYPITQQNLPYHVLEPRART